MASVRFWTQLILVLLLGAHLLGCSADGTITGTSGSSPAPAFPDPILKEDFLVKTMEEVVGPGPEVNLIWTPIPGARNYKVLVSRDEQFTVIDETLEATQAQLEYQPRDNGQYFIKVATRSPAGVLTSYYSKPLELNINKELLVAVPGMDSPLNNTVIVGTSGVSESSMLIFSWSQVAYAKGYELQLSRDEGFSDIVDSITTTKPNHLFKKIPSGLTYWRIRANGPLKNSEWSRPWSFSVK